MATEVWRVAKDPKNRISQSETELCVMLDLPEYARKQIHGWVLEQDWPEGTELHEPEKYHITLMYTPDGHPEHKDADWIEHMESAKVRITGIDVFTQDAEGRFPYVLRLHAPEVKEHAEEMQRRAEEDHGLEITHFPGGYKPHITVGYGPDDSVKADDVVELEFTAGPSFVSEPRKDDENDKTPSRKEGALPEREEESVSAWKLHAQEGTVQTRKRSVKAPIPPGLTDASGKDRCGTCKMFDKVTKVCWGYGNRSADDDPPVTEYKVCKSYDPAPGYHESKLVATTYGEAQMLDDLSLRSVAHNLHYKFEEGVTQPAALRDYAERLLKLIGYEPEDMNVMAALQSWQTLYPQDQVAIDPPSPSGELQAPPTTPTESWGYGTVSRHQSDVAIGQRLETLVQLPDDRRHGSDHSRVHHGPTDAGHDGLRRSVRGAGEVGYGAQALPPSTNRGRGPGDVLPGTVPEGPARGSEDGVGLLAGSRTARRGAAGWTSPELGHILDAFNNAYGATLLATETPGGVSFNHIEIPPENRGNGVGHRLMNQLKAYADRHGKQLQVDQVVNFPFFAQFPWLQPVGPDTFLYTGQNASAPSPSRTPSSTEPTPVSNPEDRWPDWGGDYDGERPYEGLQIGNDW